MVAHRFQDRVALVTGAGGGIGRAVSLRLAAEGAHVVVADVRDDLAAQTVDAVTAAGGTATPSVFDLPTPPPAGRPSRPCWPGTTGWTSW